MLHNSGPYGPNDAPINMGAPLNMSQMSGPMNITHNLSNLGKMPQQTSQTTSGHYDVADYSTFGHPPLGMGSPMNPFQNYSAAYQSNYVHQNPNLLHDVNLSNVQNGVSPMNLNVQSDYNSALNYHNYKRPESIVNNEYKEQGLHPKTVPINIPQVPTKAFHKHSTQSDYTHYSQGNFKSYSDNLDLSTKSEQLKKSDQERRHKNLQNTVKLIENILINSTSVSKDKTNLGEQCKSNSKIEMDLAVLDNAIDKEKDNEKEETECKQDMKLAEEMVVDPEQDSGSESEQDTKPVGLTEKILEEMSASEIETNIMVKVEPLTSWTDTEHLYPFLRDVNGVQQEATINCNVVDAENSVVKAKEDAKNDPKTDTYYECPHCNLFFMNPKRFLIHVKWHSFGLTNDKRLELAKAKELEKSLRKEAREVERLNSKEVKDPTTAEKAFPCKDCDKIFCGKSSLKNHRQRYHPTRVRECKICRKTVLGWMALRAHLATHNNESGYQCSECPKKFKYSHSLAKHRDTHLEKTHGCPQCPKKFGSNALLKMHMKTHERVLRGATYRCTYCGKGFFESYNLQVHERTHRNERPFLCEICNTSFGTNSSLKRHLKVSHSTSKPHVCTTCHRSFVSESIRDRHEMRAHGNPEDFKFTCKQCPCRYMKLKDLQKHIYKVHPKGKRRKKVKSDSD